MAPNDIFGKAEYAIFWRNNHFIEKCLRVFLNKKKFTIIDPSYKTLDKKIEIYQ